MFEGTSVAIVTPFKDGKICEKTYADLVEWQISEGIQGIVPCGTTGESATLTHEEHNLLIKLTVEIVNGRVPVIAGTGSNSTEEAVSLTQRAKDAGADGALVISPYYNKPTQEGLYQHYKTIAEAVDIPQVVYNIPGRTAVNISIETMVRLAEFSNIVAVKEASGSIDYASELIGATDLTVLAGNDNLILPLMAIGVQGSISATANLIPRLMVSLTDACLNGDWEAARDLHYKLYPFIQSVFLETNPIGPKAGLEMMGKISAEIRLPMVPISEEHKERLAKCMRTLNLV
jgi:4-hydroxy-tetrahydrodipicolinate synthase